MAGAPDNVYDNDIVSSPEMYPLAERLYDQPDASKKTSESQQEYSQLQHNKPPPVSPNVTGDPTYSHLQQDQATGGDVYSVVNEPPPVVLNVVDDPNHSQMKQDQATGGDVYSVVNKKPPRVPPYVGDDPSHSQLEQDQATNDEENQGRVWKPGGSSATNATEGPCMECKETAILYPGVQE